MDNRQKDAHLVPLVREIVARRSEANLWVGRGRLLCEERRHLFEFRQQSDSVDYLRIRRQMPIVRFRRRDSIASAAVVNAVAVASLVAADSVDAYLVAAYYAAAALYSDAAKEMKTRS